MELPLILVRTNKFRAGGGSADYNASSKTLTLTNAEITQQDGTYSRGISIPDSITSEFKIVLVGKNRIKSDPSDDLIDGIVAAHDLSISGSGTLDVEVQTNDVTGQKRGAIISRSGIVTVKDATLNLKEASGTDWDTVPSNKLQNLHSVGIGSSNDNLSNPRKARFDHANITIEGFSSGLDASTITGSNYCGMEIVNGSDMIIKDVYKGIMTNHNYVTSADAKVSEIVIANSSLNLTAAANGIYGRNITMENAKATVKNKKDWDAICAYDQGCVTIVNSAVTAESPESTAIFSDKTLKITGKSDIVTKAKYCGLMSNEAIAITGSKINADSAEDSAVYSAGKLDISGKSELTTKGFYCGLQSNGDMTITGGSAEAISSDDFGIFTTGSLYIDDCLTHAKGGSNLAGIGVRTAKTVESAPAAKISIENVYEKNEGKIAVSDWYTTDGTTRWWTSFIDKKDDTLDLNNSRMANPLNEVWLIPLRAPEFTVHPKSQTVVSDSSATFYAEASGAPDPVYQWQKSADNGASWTDIPGAAGKTYKIDHVSSSDGELQFRCMASNRMGEAYSNTATLHVVKSNPSGGTGETGTPGNHKGDKHNGVSNRPSTGDESQPLWPFGVLLLLTGAVLAAGVWRYYHEK